MAEISKKTLLEVKNLSKSFGDLRVLKDISMEVEQSEVISIIGPSGSGKSTFLRCLTMLEKIDGGSIAYCGETAVTSENGTVCYAAKSDLRRIQGYFGLVANFWLSSTLSSRASTASCEYSSGFEISRLVRLVIKPVITP